MPDGLDMVQTSKSIPKPQIHLPFLYRFPRPPIPPLLAGLPHFDAVDGESALLPVAGPVVPPPILCGPKVGHCRSGIVDPWFTAFSIGEPAVCGANSEVEDEVECYNGRVSLLACMQ